MTIQEFITEKIIKHIEDYDLFDEEKEQLTVNIDGIDFNLKLTCKFQWEEGELNEYGFAKKVFSHVEDKHIKVLEIYGLNTELEIKLNENL